jgi:sugar O-acyltransferase (sialic acid O-acetyltransferase NeuD family)
MSTDTWIIVGAGGHARVVMDALLCVRGETCSCAFADDDVSLTGKNLLGRLVLGTTKEVVLPEVNFHVAVGTNRTRELIYRRMVDAAGVAFTVVHPAASVSPYATLGKAVFVAARAVIAPAATIGLGAIINHSAVVDHDCIVGDFSHVAPGATLSGGVKLGHGVFVGTGARVLPGVIIGEGAIIGAGAVVMSDVASKTKVVGVPARTI